MAQVVLVPGIGHEQHDPAWMHQRWLAYLGTGLSLAHYPDVAEQLLDPAGRLRAVMATYADLFLTPGQQGASQWTGQAGQEQDLLAEQLAAEWLARAAERSHREADRQVAREEQAYLGPRGQEQGARVLVRKATGSVVRIPWFARAGIAGLTWVNRAFSQVTSYLTDEAVREAVLARVTGQIGTDTQVVIAHSLGSVVAYEAVHRLDRPLPLLLTVGSPLGLDTIVYHRVRPQPPGYPAQVRRWVNLADPDDIIAAHPDLTPRFGRMLPAGCVLDCQLVDNAGEPHHPGRYLSTLEAGGPVGQILAGASCPG